MPDLGDVLPFSADLYSAPPDQGGELVNALTVALTITKPDGTSVTPTLGDPVSTGLYRYNHVSTTAGRHVGRWLFTFFGGSTTAYVETFDVRPADPGYILSLSDAKAALNVPVTETSDDEEIRSLVEAVTIVVEDHVGEAIVRRTVTDHLWAGGSDHLLTNKVPIISVTSVLRGTDDYTWPTADLSVRTAEWGEVVSDGEPFYGDLTVVYVAGRTVIPANYIEAAKVILKHLWQTQQTAGMGPRVFGGEEPPVSLGMGYAVPNRAIELLGGRGPVVA